MVSNPVQVSIPAGGFVAPPKSAAGFVAAVDAGELRAALAMAKPLAATKNKYYFRGAICLGALPDGRLGIAATDGNNFLTAFAGGSVHGDRTVTVLLEDLRKALGRLKGRVVLTLDTALFVESLEGGKEYRAFVKLWTAENGRAFPAVEDFAAGLVADDHGKVESVKSFTDRVKAVEFARDRTELTARWCVSGVMHVFDDGKAESAMIGLAATNTRALAVSGPLAQFAKRPEQVAIIVNPVAIELLAAVKANPVDQLTAVPHHWPIVPPPGEKVPAHAVPTRAVVFGAESFHLIAKGMDGRFPPVHDVWPKRSGEEREFRADALLKALDDVCGAFPAGKGEYAKFVLEGGKLALSRTGDGGESVAASVSGTSDDPYSPAVTFYSTVFFWRDYLRIAAKDGGGVVRLKLSKGVASVSGACLSDALFAIQDLL